MSHWDIHKSAELYRIQHWGEGYFSINDAGELCVCGIALSTIVKKATQTGLRLPLLIRFPDILHDRVRLLNNAFSDAMSHCQYQGGYRAIYPIKVNQQQHVVKQLLNNPFAPLGLEVGSKPELLASIGLSPAQGIIICNGYKDREYLRLALISLALGHRSCIVIEKLSELSVLLEESNKLNIEPVLGVRVRLFSIATGNWQNSGGSKAKFGLSSGELLQLLEQLKHANRLHCLQLLHCHMGSQIADIQHIRVGIQECVRYYTELSQLGAELRYFDVGGGLAVDYEGRFSESFYSMNYSLNDYATTIVQAIHSACQQYQLPSPMILTESGRALTAHHALLLSNVIHHPQHSHPATTDRNSHHHEIQLLTDLTLTLFAQQDISTIVENYHSAAAYYQQINQQYIDASITLQQHAHAEQLFVVICKHVRQCLNTQATAHPLLQTLNDIVADKYFCNLSIFQSLPDIWGIEQIFPIMPIQDLQQQPDCRVVLEDLTCDSDGRIDKFVDSFGVDSSLPVHRMQQGKPYLLGFFLLGAYQEILGDMHNLFGDTDSVHVRITGDSEFELLEPQSGHTVADVLRYVHFNCEDLKTHYQQQLTRSSLTVSQQQHYYKILTAGLCGYTYLEEQS